MEIPIETEVREKKNGSGNYNRYNVPTKFVFKTVENSK